jgi:transcriptional regulator with XRE-family HTH domain
MTTPEIIREAGHVLMQIRKDTYGWNQRQVEAKSREQWGEDREIDQAVLSKIERGATAKPPSLREAALLCILYKKPLSWFAELYGLPVVRVEEGHYKEPIMDKLYAVLDRLPANDLRRERLIRWVDFAIQQTLFESDNGKSA